MINVESGVRFVTGKRAVLDELLATASSAQEFVDVEAFRMRGGFAEDLVAGISTDATTRILASAEPAAQAEIGRLTEPLGSRAASTRYGEHAGFDTFNHAKLVNADGHRLTVSTAAMSLDTLDRLDWGLTVTGDAAQAAAEVAATYRSPVLHREALARAATHGLHFNDPVTQVYDATDYLVSRLAALSPGDEVSIATKKATSKDAAALLNARAEQGVGIHLTAARSNRKAGSMLQDGAVDFALTPWPGVSLHGNLYIFPDEVALGTMYLANRPLGWAKDATSREVLVATRDPDVIAQAQAAYDAIKRRH